MGILQVHLSALSQSQSFGEDTDPRRILSRLWLQSKVRHCQAQRSHTLVPTSRKALAPCPHLQLSSAFDPASRLGSVGLPLVSASESFTPALVAVGQKTLPKIEQQLLSISARQIDRRLQARKTQLQRRLYGRTKPGTLLKHHIPIKTDSWNVKTPGFTEIDLVSHSGNSEKGEFIYSLNVTDIYSTSVETRARHRQRPIRGENRYGRHRAASAL